MEATVICADVRDEKERKTKRTDCEVNAQRPGERCLGLVRGDGNTNLVDLPTHRPATVAAGRSVQRSEKSPVSRV